jgi:hypothetical protein
MDSLELPRVTDHHTFYLSSCESGTGIDIQDSNVSSRNASTSSSFSNSNVDTSTTISSIHKNIFLDVLKRLYCSTLRRRKHGRYGTLSSSLHLFFKKPYHPSENQFYKSPSSPQLTTDTNKSFLSKKSRSHQQLHIINTNNDKHLNIKNRRSLLRHIRASDKTVSEDNNTNTMSSLDLATIPPAVLITDSTSSATCMQQIIPIDIKRVSDLLLCTKTFIAYPSYYFFFLLSLLNMSLVFFWHRADSISAF